MEDLERDGAPAAEGCNQRVGGLVEVPGLLRRFGVDSRVVLDRAGLTADDLASPENRISFAAGARLLGECAAATGCAHFGLLVGSRWGLAQFGLLGEVMRHSATVGEALQSLAIYQRLNSAAAAVFLLEQAGTLSVGYAIYARGVSHPAQVYDAAMAITCNLLRELCGPAWAASEVVLSRAEPDDPTPYRQHFRAPLRFDHDHSAVRFPAHWQGLPIANADRERRRRMTAELEAGDGGHLVSKLHRALRLLLLAKKTSGDDLAQALSLHRRTLSRRLHKQGVTFQNILDEVRFEVARHLLEHTRTPIVQIATALCYADASAFTRAFRRWTGTSPGEWRERPGEPFHGSGA